MKISLLAGASCLALIACGGATSDQAAGTSTGGSSGALVTGGAAGSSGGAGARNSGGQTLGGSGGVSAGGSGGSGAISNGGAGGIGVDCCVSGCDEPCTPGTSRTCKGGTPPGSTAQDCRCDGSGWDGVRSITTAGGACSVLDAGAPRCNGPTLTPLNLYPNCDGKAQTICVEVPGQVCYCDGTTAFGFGIPVPIRHLGPCTDAERADAAAGSGGAPSDASPNDAGSYCIYEAPGAGGMPSTHCLPFPNGCASCSCISLPYSFCTCTNDPSGVLVRCLGV